MRSELQDLAAVSRRLGSDLRYVFLGGGNTSFKDAGTLYIKPSGVALSAIQPEQFIAMDRQALQQLMQAPMPADWREREAKVKQLMTAAVRPESTGRPSVEAPLHELLPFPFVVHLHPTLVNGMTCGVNGRDACRKLFPKAVWMEYVDPGFTLAQAVTAFLKKQAKPPRVLFLQNHGVFVGGESLAAIEAEYTRMLDILAGACRAAGVPLELLAAESADAETVLATAPALRTLLGSGETRAVVAAAGWFTPAAGPLTPDHLVYAKAFAHTGDITHAALDAYRAGRGYAPRVAGVPGKAVFTAGTSLKDTRDVLVAARDAALVAQYAQAFGGPRYLTDQERGFIENWEVESYRRSIAQGGQNASGNRLAAKVAVITGAAQGFGLGIARGLAAEGAIVVVADLNLDGAKKVATDLEAEFGTGHALAVGVNVSDEESVAAMTLEITRVCGGFDLFVANAGVLRAGSVKTLSKADWDFVTAVNYTGYFLCVKHAARIMAAQKADGRGPWGDIVQVNSKSGLQGSNKNGAYAGGKFGAIGLTQSFAMELVADHIKVNSICPGNFFEGPLWSDPDRGLFVQYLRANKVPGATSIAEVKKFYEGKVPMGRGCRPEDVVRAILYTVEQPYETGQAIPVTGGQVMLHA